MKPLVRILVAAAAVAALASPVLAAPSSIQKKAHDAAVAVVKNFGG